MHARGRERQHLARDAMLIEHAFAVVEVAVARNENVVVARVMQTRVSLGVEVHPYLEPAGLDRVQVLRRVIVIVKVDDHVATAPRDSRARGESQRWYTGSPAATAARPMTLFKGSATT